MVEAPRLHDVGRSADCDVIVVGAGSAGIAAARELLAHNYSVRVLEARARIGGRAYTEAVTFGVPADHGCHWLHSADVNPLTPIARELGFTVVERNPAWAAAAGKMILSSEELEQCEQAFEWFFRQTRKNADNGDSLASVFPRDWRWEPMARALITYMYGAEAEDISREDGANYLHTGQDWPIREGYGGLIATLGADLPITLNAAVDRIDWSGKSVAIHSNGSTLHARAVVLTVSTAVLAAHVIDFNPALAPGKLEAIHNLPLGVNNKVLIAVDGDPFGVPMDTFLISSVESSRVSSLEIFLEGRPLVSGFLGGDLAIELEQAGERAAIEFVADELVQLFGNTVRNSLGKSIATAWSSDPWSRGAYSYAKPGHAHQRPALAAPLAERLFFAGEATSVESYGTAHGAYLSGRRVAAEVNAALATG
ncbi:MAG: flavin monoamine oxidase family protein [Gammaproteobacteria bacterium]